MPCNSRLDCGNINLFIPFVMTTMEIILSCIGMILCAIIFSLVCIVIAGIVWYTFKTDKDIETEEREEEQ